MIETDLYLQLYNGLFSEIERVTADCLDLNYLKTDGTPPKVFLLQYVIRI